MPFDDTTPSPLVMDRGDTDGDFGGHTSDNDEQTYGWYTDALFISWNYEKDTRGTRSRHYAVCARMQKPIDDKRQEYSSLRKWRKTGKPTSKRSGKNGRFVD